MENHKAEVGVHTAFTRTTPDELVACQIVDSELPALIAGVGDGLLDFSFVEV